MGPGPLIAIDVILLYTILGPLVLFGIYILFDSLDPTGKTKQDKARGEKDPALWTRQDIETFGADGTDSGWNEDRA